MLFSTSLTIPKKLFTTVNNFITLGRFKFLVYSSMNYLLGALIYFSLFGQMNSFYFLLGWASVAVVHLMTHYSNEYFDLPADRANKSFTKWTGGSRILVDGKLPPIASLATAIILFLVGIGLVFLMPNIYAQITLSAALFFGWFYTAPPFRFNYNGLGEVTVAITLVLLVPLHGFLIQDAATIPPIFWALVPGFIIQVARMMVMNLADHLGDVQTGKETLIIKLGVPTAIRLYQALHLIAYATLPLLYLFTDTPILVLLLIATTIPLSLAQWRRITTAAHEQVETANALVFWASTHSAWMLVAFYLGVLLSGIAIFPLHIIALFGLPLAFTLYIVAKQIKNN